MEEVSLFSVIFKSLGPNPKLSDMDISALQEASKEVEPDELQQKLNELERMEGK
jgi:hypothetical protein